MGWYGMVVEISSMAGWKSSMKMVHLYSGNIIELFMVDTV
jgi:hypothetical protein